MPNGASTWDQFQTVQQQQYRSFNDDADEIREERICSAARTLACSHAVILALPLQPHQAPIGAQPRSSRRSSIAYARRRRVSLARNLHVVTNCRVGPSANVCVYCQRSCKCQILHVRSSARRMHTLSSSAPSVTKRHNAKCFEVLWRLMVARLLRQFCSGNYRYNRYNLAIFCKSVFLLFEQSHRTDLFLIKRLIWHREILRVEA